MASTLDSSLPILEPHYPPRSDPSKPPSSEPPHLATLISALQLRAHVEGGYFAETDRAKLRIPNPFKDQGVQSTGQLAKAGYAADSTDATRAASTTILYLLTPGSPQGCFHRNRGRTIHTLIKGRGRYVLLHADEVTGPARAEVFTVGLDVAKGERVQWIVEGGKYKASYLLPDGEGRDEGLLIAETVVPGFEFEDHDFLTDERAAELLRPEQIKEVNWLLRGN
ncbi:hypothetical protein K461DRAFT_250014 [Myriangium duriaei CBS 260.36]|uniref:DUF985 domain-containing protein n=1 Tax=Myriangium duriaei CBS 260.36 TaxID=1168546 RepID=A0A9P4J995_9PEZI|nr:hypothetical protein K461DRAFT_250014 [Myriangium duriaei CBS 260.36]